MKKTLYKKAFWFIVFVAGTCTSMADTSFIRLATTTSTVNSGLLDILLPASEKGNEYTVKVISVGTGKALPLVREGDVDVVLVHASTGTGTAVYR